VRFWDASALVPLCVDEGRGAEVDRLLREDPRMTVWWGTPVECASAIARRRRAGALSATEQDSALEVLDRLSTAWFEIQPRASCTSHRAGSRAARFVG